MKKLLSVSIASLALGLACAAAIAPAQAQDVLRMFTGLQKGSWEVRFRDGTPPRRICVRSGSELIQLRHSGRCNRYVVEDGASQVTVQYTCPGNGYGRTNVRRESAALVQIDSQGIAGGKPFQFSAEARRVGSCS